MKKILLILVVVIGFVFMTNAQESKPTIVVNGHSSGWWFRERETKNFIDIFRSELVNSGKFKVIDLSLLNEKVEEMDTNKSWCRYFSNATLCKSANLIGIDKILNINRISHSGKMSFEILDVKSGVVEKLIIANGVISNKKKREKVLSELLK